MTTENAVAEKIGLVLVAISDALLAKLGAGFVVRTVAKTDGPSPQGMVFVWREGEPEISGRQFAAILPIYRNLGFDSRITDTLRVEVYRVGETARRNERKTGFPYDEVVDLIAASVKDSYRDRERYSQRSEAMAEAARLLEKAGILIRKERGGYDLPAIESDTVIASPNAIGEYGAQVPALSLRIDGRFYVPADKAAEAVAALDAFFALVVEE